MFNKAGSNAFELDLTQRGSLETGIRGKNFEFQN